MSYGSTAALQQAVFAALVADTEVATLSGGAIYDALPPGPVPEIYVSLGPERVRDASDVGAGASVHEFPVSVVADSSSFQSAKQLAAAISDALVDANLILDRGILTGLHFRRARARKVGDVREIDIWFRAFIDGQPA